MNKEELTEILLPFVKEIGICKMIQEYRPSLKYLFKNKKVNLEEYYILFEWKELLYSNSITTCRITVNFNNIYSLKSIYMKMLEIILNGKGVHYKKIYNIIINNQDLIKKSIKYYNEFENFYDQ